MDDVGGIAVVVLTFRADPDLFDACLRSVAAAGGAAHVIVVDNGQTVARERVDAVFAGGRRRPRALVLLSCADNLGYAGGDERGPQPRPPPGRGRGGGAQRRHDRRARLAGSPGGAPAGLRGGRGAAEAVLASGPSSGPPVLNSVGVRLRADGAGHRHRLRRGRPRPAGRGGGHRAVHRWRGAARRRLPADRRGVRRALLPLLRGPRPGSPGRPGRLDYRVEPRAVVHHAMQLDRPHGP